MSYTYPTRRATLATPTRQKPVWKWSPLVLGFCLLQGVAVRASEALTGNGLEPQGSTSPSGGPVILTPFKYIPPPGPSKKPANESAPKKRTPEQQRVIELNAAGNYQAIANEGIPKGTGDKPTKNCNSYLPTAWHGPETYGLRLLRTRSSHPGCTQTRPWSAQPMWSDGPGEKIWHCPCMKRSCNVTLAMPMPAKERNWRVAS
jgi:hypothetical protein